MQRLQPIDPKSATGKTKELFGAVQKKMGMVPNILKTMANSPAALGAYMGMSGALGEGVLSPALREKMALLTAKINNCEYCLTAHSFVAKKMGLSEKDVQDSINGVSADKKEAAILQFVRLIVEKRAEVTDEDVSNLRNAGLSEAEVVEIVANTAKDIFTNYFNHVVGTVVDFPK